MEEYKPTFTIKQWNEDDRPREKFLSKGKIALSEAELLAILINSGSVNESAVSLSKRVLASVDNNLNELVKLTLNDLQSFRGIGVAKAISIAAALELGRRINLSKGIEKFKINSSISAYDIMRPIIGNLTHEEFWIIYLNNSNKIIKTSQLSKGGLTGTVVDIRIAFKNALSLNAVAVILAHNHPSGTLKPSEADLQLTRKMKKAGDSLDIKVLDHLIITENDYFSFADESLL